MRVDPGDVLALGIKHRGSDYIDMSLAFGPVNGTAIFQRISDAIRKILRKEIIAVWNYIDDIFTCNPSEGADKAFNRILELTCELGGSPNS